MSGARLHAVPAPEPEPETAPAPAPVPVPVPGVGEWPVPVAASVLPAEDPDDNDPAAEGEPIEDEVEDRAEPERLRALTFPDLRPYLDVRPLAELGPLAIEVGKVSAPPVLRAAGRGLRAVGRAGRFLGRGLAVLLVLLIGWLNGTLGKRGSMGARLGGAAFAAYGVFRLSLSHPAAPLVFAAALLLAVFLAATGRITAPAPKPAPAKKGAAARKKGAAGKGKPAPAEGAPEESPTAAVRPGLVARLKARRKSASDTPAEDAEPAPEQDAEQAPEDVPEDIPEKAREDVPATPEPAPPVVTSEAVIRLLHRHVGGGSGVLLTTLRDHLGLADTRTVKGVLDQARIQWRSGVRAEAGNGPGVHRDDFPRLPLRQESPPGAGVVAGQEPTTNANNADALLKEGLCVLPTDSWSAEELAEGKRWVRNFAGGPSAWSIQYLNR